MSKHTKPTEPQEAAETVVQNEEIDYQSLYQRALADLENVRKRADEEKRVLIKYGIGELVLELLPVLDNFSRATEHVPAEQQGNAWTTGILHIRKQLMDILAERGVSEVIPKVGEPFDAATQEAIDTVVGLDQAEDTVAVVHGVGFRLHERVIRPARVSVFTHEAK